jgi:hypothetical protein
VPSLLESARRYAALAAAVLRARRGPFDPFKLTWILTERCSLTCATCRLWAGAPHAGPSLDEIDAVLAANRHLTWLNLSGGDLVERPDAPAILERCARLPDLALLDFPTAGQDTRATLAALEPALESAVPRLLVTVSLDGPDEVHDRVRGRRGAAARARATLRALQRLRRPGLSVYAGQTLSRANLPPDAVQDPRRWLPEGVAPRDVHLNLAHHSTHYYRNAAQVAPPAEAALAVVAEVARARRASLSPVDLVERRYWRRAERFLREGDAGLRCGALRASIFLAADLTVYPCSIFDRPLGRLADIGYALRRVPELPGAHAALGEVQAGACPRCWSPCEAFPTLLLHLGRGA